MHLALEACAFHDGLLLCSSLDLPHSTLLALQYIDALRFGNLEKFKMIEEACKGWWFPTLDRGLGAALHFAVDHGQARPTAAWAWPSYAFP